MKYSKKILISLAFACFAAGTLSAAPAESLGATVRGANRGAALPHNKRHRREGVDFF